MSIMSLWYNYVVVILITTPSVIFLSDVKNKLCKMCTDTEIETCSRWT